MKVSIIIINYNDKTRINRAIESCINQTWEDKEVILVDDGSDEETREIYKKYASKIKLVQLERGKEETERRTPSRARNAGIKVATGAFICFLDSDNYYDLNFVAECMKYNYNVMFCDWQIIGLHNEVIKINSVWDQNRSLLDNYLKYTRLDHQCLMIKKEILDQVGYYDERLPRSQDCDLIVRLMRNTEQWKYIPKILFFFEKHEEDQNKAFASLYGKMLWTLKNNIPIQWFVYLVQANPGYFLCIYQAIYDFMHKKEWEVERKSGEFNRMYVQFLPILEGQQKENV